MPYTLTQITYTYNAMCANGWINYVSIVMTQEQGKKIEIEPKYISLIIIYKYKVIE